MTIISDVFLGKQFVLDLPANTNPKWKNNLRDKIAKHNGVISYIVTKNSDYVITTSKAVDESESFKTATANKFNIPVVNDGFIDACLKNGHLVDHNEYLLKKNEEEQKVSWLEKGKIQLAHETTFDKPKTNKIKENYGKVKTWHYKDENGPRFHEKSHQVVKAVLFMGKVKNQGTPFSLLELHVQDGTQKDEYRFCVFLHQGYLPSNKGTKDCRYFYTSDQALNAYTKLCKQFTNPPNSMKKTTRFPDVCHFQLGSDQIKANEWFTCSIPFDSSTQHFVNLIWNEAENKLEEELSCNWKDISSDKLEKAAGYLLDFEKSRDCMLKENLTRDYFKEIERIGSSSLTDYLEEMNILQLIRDRHSLSELSSSKNSEYELKYRALRCGIEHLEKESNDYEKIKNLFSSVDDFNIQNAYRVVRADEDEEYKKDIGNEKMLFHGTSYSNIVSILSRGLLLPRTKGDSDSDEDTELDLGFGLYFGSSVNGMLEYAFPSHISGTRLLLIHQVALGISYETYTPMPHLKKPPQGFDSVHGMKGKGENGLESCFSEDEYVIYDEKQQRLCYVVEFQLHNDKSIEVKLQVNNKEKMAAITDEDAAAAAAADDDVMAIVNVDDILHPKKSKLDKMGLQPIRGENKVILKNVAIIGKLFDLAAEVVILQEYENESSEAIEAKYYFPIDEMAAVCNFEAFLNGRHVIGRVDEKEQAKTDYKQAVSQGKSALLMDQESPDLFSISVGNIQPKSKILIKISYVTELDLEGDDVCFRLPPTICPRPQVDKSDTVSVNVSEVKTSLELSLEMPYDIRSITSFTHRIKMKKTDTIATIKMEENQQFDERGFHLLVKLAEIHCPRMWTEEDEENGTQSCMLTFYPEFEANETTKTTLTQIVLILDASNSMEKSFEAAQKLAVLCLHNLPAQCSFNVVAFGSIYEELFPDCQLMSLELIQEAKIFISKLKPTRGDSFAKSIFRSNFLLGPSTDIVRNILFISDGYLNDNCENLLKCIRTNCIHNGSARLFTLAVGSSANRHLMKNLAIAGAGDFETFDNFTKRSSWLEKIERLMSKVQMPVLTDIFVEWQIFDENKRSTLIQTPRNITSLFNGSRLIVYGILKDASTLMAVLKARIPGGKQMSTIVSPYESSKSRGKIVHRLAVRALVRDWESGALDIDRTEHESVKRNLKSTLVKLGKSYSIVTPFTSFVAIDENDSKSVGNLQITFQEFVAKESTDRLSYLSYEEAGEQEEETFTVDCVTKIKQTKPKINKEFEITEDEMKISCLGVEQATPEFESQIKRKKCWTDMSFHHSFAPASKRRSAPPTGPTKEVKRSICMPFASSAGFGGTLFGSQPQNSVALPGQLRFRRQFGGGPPPPPACPPLPVCSSLPAYLPMFSKIQPSTLVLADQGMQFSTSNSFGDVISYDSCPSPLAASSVFGNSKQQNLESVGQEMRCAMSMVETRSALEPGSFNYAGSQPVLGDAEIPIQLIPRKFMYTSVEKREPKALVGHFLKSKSRESTSANINLEDSSDEFHGYGINSSDENEILDDKSVSRDGWCDDDSSESDDLVLHSCPMPEFDEIRKMKRRSAKKKMDVETFEVMTKRKKKKILPIIEDKDFIWVLLDAGCINYGSGLPFFSTYLKNIPILLMSQDVYKMVLRQLADMQDDDGQEYLEIVCSMIFYYPSVPKRLNNELWDDIKMTLYQKGLKSLPKSSKAAALLIIIMISLVFEEFRVVCSSMFPLRLNDLQEIKDSVGELINIIEEEQSTRDSKADVLVESIVTVNSLHPMLYRTLQIGRSWEEAFQILTNGRSLIL